MKATFGGLAAALGLVLLATACTESGAGGREVNITQTADGCTPTSVAVTPGEKLQFVVKNESDHDVYELEGIEGTKLEEFVVPSGKTRKSGYTVPDAAAGTYKLKCYVPTGPSTIIELVAGAGATPGSGDATEQPAPGGVAGPADDTVDVGLTEYVVTPDKSAVKAGKIKFVATNTSASMTHELAVLKKKDDGTFENAGEIEDIAPGEGGEVILDLAPGTYQLACLIVPGEAGSTVDHYKEGMHTPFTVE
jgi:plastocyanin